MGKGQRTRWKDNVRCMKIVSKNDSEITNEDRKFLKESFTGQGGLIPNGFNGGQFLTPPRVTKMIWDMLKPHLTNNPKVLEPSCGSGAFLEYAPPDSNITGIELDKSSARIAQLIYPQANIICDDSIIHNISSDFDLVIGNPPFGISIEESFDNNPQFADWKTLKKSKNKKKETIWKGKSENVFLELAIKHVKPGGYIAFILPPGIAFAQASENVRKLMYETCWQVANIHLPGETFQHVGTTVSTDILIVRKVTPNAKMISTCEKKWGSNARSNYGSIEEYDAHFFQGQQPAFFAEIVDVGIDKKGNETDSNELEDLAEYFNDSLVRENLYPHVPSWFGMKDNSAFFMSHGNGMCDGHRVAESYGNPPYYWQELTLGAGKEYEYNGEMVSSFDFDVQDQIVEDYYPTNTKKNEEKRNVEQGQNDLKIARMVNIMESLQERNYSFRILSWEDGKILMSGKLDKDTVKTELTNADLSCPIAELINRLKGIHDSDLHGKKMVKYNKSLNFMFDRDDDQFNFRYRRRDKDNQKFVNEMFSIEELKIMSINDWIKKFDE